MAVMATAATSSATAVIAGARCPAAANAAPRQFLLTSPTSRRSAFSSAVSIQADAQRFSLIQVRATSEDTSVQTDELLADLKEKWDAIENKSTVFVYGGGAIVALWLSSIIVGAINSIPLLPKLMELVGLGYTGWFVYRYLLFKQSRKELAEDIEALKKKIAGTEE